MLKKHMQNLLNFLTKIMLKGPVCLGNNSTVNYMHIFMKKKCQVVIGDNTMQEARIYFDKENAIVSIGNRCFIGYSKIVCSENVTIGDDVLISWGCTIVDHNSHSIYWDERCDDVINWIHGKKNWSNVNIKPVKIGNKVNIEPGAHIDRDIPDNSNVRATVNIEIGERKE